MRGITILRQTTNPIIRQYELAERVGVTRVAVSQWERGIVKPRYEHVVKLCEIFNCSPEDLNG
jgi:transcriptional regulator with XRE-family HTH domain